MPCSRSIPKGLRAMGGGLRGRWRDGTVGKASFLGSPGWQGKGFSAKRQAGNGKKQSAK